MGGQFAGNRREGFGRMHWMSGRWKTYEGSWKDGLQHGTGTLIDHDGQEFKGVFNAVNSSVGKMTWVRCLDDAPGSTVGLASQLQMDPSACCIPFCVSCYSLCRVLQALRP